MNRYLLPLVLVVPLAVTFGIDRAAATVYTADEHYWMTALSCQPPAGHAGYLDYRENGVGNVSSTVAEVFCPTFDGSDSASKGIDFISLFVTDASHTHAVSCYVYGSDYERNTLWSPTKSTTTADPPSPYWWTGATRLDFDPGAIVAGDYYRQRVNWSVRCYLPPTNGNSRSWVKQMLIGVADISDWSSAE